MKIFRVMCCIAVAVVLLFSKTGWGEETNDAIEEMSWKIEKQGIIIRKQQETIDLLMQRIANIEARMQAKPLPLLSVPKRVSLEEDSTLPASEVSEEHVLARPWYKNIRIDGFGAGGIVGTVGKAVKQHSGFINYEATLNIDAQVWEDIWFFTELQTIRMGDESTKWARTQEAYVHFKDVFQTLFNKEGMGIGAKIGREDIPFGEDYLIQDVIDNPLITFPAAYPYGVDEGLVLYGKIKGVHWIFGVMDSNDTRGAEENKDKFVSLKLYGNPTEALYLSGSFFRNGESAKSAWELGGSHFEPIGAGGRVSSVGSSGSSTVDAFSYEFDAKYMFGHDRYLKAQYGYIFLDDDNSAFDRDIYYFQIEPKWNLGSRFENKWYLVGRFSSVGTFNDGKGYSFDGKPFAGGASSFGYDTKALYRYAVGLGFTPSPGTLIKLEYSRDDFRLIDSSTKDGGSDGRDLFGMLMAVKF